MIHYLARLFRLSPHEVKKKFRQYNYWEAVIHEAYKYKREKYLMDNK